MTGRRAKKLDADGLVPVRTNQLQLFAVDLEVWSPKGDRHSMEHDFFRVAKQPDRNDRRYEHPDGTIIEVAPNSAGIPTIWDKDIVLYCIAHIRDRVKHGHHFPKGTRVVLDSFNILASTNRGTGAAQYESLTAAIKRLNGCAFRTSIPAAGKRIERFWHWLEDVEMVWNDEDSKKRVLQFSCRLPDWLHEVAISGTDVLTYSWDYFRIDSGIERRMYELARKHCGHQESWSIGLDSFAAKAGLNAGQPGASADVKREFRKNLRHLLPAVIGRPGVYEKQLPDYTVTYLEARQRLEFTNRAVAAAKQKAAAKKAATADPDEYE